MPTKGQVVYWLGLTILAVAVVLAVIAAVTKNYENKAARKEIDDRYDRIKDRLKRKHGQNHNVLTLNLDSFNEALKNRNFAMGKRHVSPSAGNWLYLASAILGGIGAILVATGLYFIHFEEAEERAEMFHRWAVIEDLVDHLQQAPQADEGGEAAPPPADETDVELEADVKLFIEEIVGTPDRPAGQ